MNNYKDVDKKLEFYKEQVLQEFIKKGVYPDDVLIESRLKSFDAHVSIFKNYNAVTGNLFNVNQYNERLRLIYTDLSFLYELLHELTIQEYNKLQSFINSYLSELNSIVETYKKRAEYENNSTTLGKTLLFKNNSFSIESKDSLSIIHLGKLSIPNASILACIANINNLKTEDIVFIFKDNNGVEYNSACYNHNNETIIMPGEAKKNIYEYKLQDNQKINGPLIIDTKTDIDIKNKYTILGGHNKIFVNFKDDNGFIVEEKPLTIDSLSFDKKAYINFYVVGGNSIAFKFNKKPVATNFPIEAQRIESLNYVHHFFIECDENFSFQLELDKGNVYAIKETGIISDKKLYYSGSDKVSDFLIIETTVGEEKDYDVRVESYNSNEDIEIDSIIIKQLD